MKVKEIFLMFNLLHSCSMYADGNTPKTTNGLHAEIPEEIPRTEKQNVITLPGLIAVICIIIIIIITSLYCTIKKYCWINRHSASLEVSQTLRGESFSPTDTNTIHSTYPVFSYWTVSPAWAPPAYPCAASYISQSAVQPDDNDVLPPRYSSIFDNNGQEIVPVNHE